MSATYPTARFLGIVAAGDFTGPARELVRGYGIDLFYVPKEKVVKAFEENGLIMDYPDASPENYKQQIAAEFEANFSLERKQAVARSLTALMGKAVVNSYVDRVRSKLSALPQEIRFLLRHDSTPVVFQSLAGATAFLQDPLFSMDTPIESYLYQVTYSDGSEFEQVAASLDDLRSLHDQISALADHMNDLR